MLTIVHSLLFVFTVFRSLNHVIAMVNNATKTIDGIFSGNHLITPYIFGLF